jgi:hypothetical protein
MFRAATTADTLKGKYRSMRERSLGCICVCHWGVYVCVIGLSFVSTLYPLPSTGRG